MPHPEERRRHTRYEVHDLTGHLRADDRAQVLDLSVNGLAIETDAWLQVGETYTVRVQAGEDQLDVAGKVSWCRLVAMAPRDSGERRPRYRAGIEFGDALTDKARRILSFAQRNGLVARPDRVFARFVPSRQAVDAAVDHPCEIRRASAGGLLLRCGRRPEMGERLVLRFEISGKPMATTVEVRDVQEAEPEEADGAPVHDIGVAFVELTLEQRAALDRLLEPSRHEPSRHD
jgi:Tfp pilus assembly protein PilZ